MPRPPTSCTTSASASASPRTRPAGFAAQLQLTVADLVAEVHDTHHPIASGLYYEDQKPEARAAPPSFRDERIPKFLGYFERVLAAEAAAAPISSGRAHVRRSVAVPGRRGPRYAFPEGDGAPRRECPAARRAARSRRRPAAIAAYLASDRRIPFNEDGIFRHYPELDG